MSRIEASSSSPAAVGLKRTSMYVRLFVASGSLSTIAPGIAPVAVKSTLSAMNVTSTSPSAKSPVSQ